MGGQQDRPQQPGAGGVMVLCTYCGSLSIRTDKCSNCNGHFDLLSRQRTQNGMGPWFIRDQVNPFHPGCSYETLRRLVARGRVRPDTVMRGPTTRQFWSFARNTPGVAHLLGACHACHVPVDSSAHACPSCNASFVVIDDRQQLGLAPIQMLPGDADPSAVADAAFGPATPPPEAPALHSSAGSSSGADLAPDETSRAAVRTSKRPTRKRSSGPMVAVVASVCCAVIALAAVVYMNRADATTGAAAASESSVGRIPTDDDRAADQSRPGRQTESPPASEQAIDEAALPDLTVEPSAGTDDSSRVVPVDADTPERAETGTNTETESGDPPAVIAEAPEGVQAEVDPLGSAVVGRMTLSELEDARVAWAADGREQLVNAADRRAQQLRLRSLFTDR